MQKLYIVLLLLVTATMRGYAQDSLNMSRLSHWDDNTLPIAPGQLNLQYNGIWALTVSNHEYAVMGGAGHVLFFDITNPAQPQFIGKYAGTAITIWREFKSYKNRVYAVSDNTSEGLMIFDLTETPVTNTITRTYFSNEIFNAAHSITLDSISGHIYLNGGSSGSGMTILDVSQNPDVPQLVAKVDVLPGGYIHDSYVRNDTLYASSGYNGYYIYDFKTDPANPILLSSISTGGYNHNSWLTPDGQYAYYTEEVPNGLPIRIVDLSNLTTTGSLEGVGSFLDALTPGDPTPTPTPHNLYIKDNLLYDSQYEDGLLVYDITDRIAPVLIAHYDTHPENTIYNGYYGNWGNYPWLPSGTIVTSDMQNGLNLLRIGLTSGTSEQNTPALSAKVYPNPTQGTVVINLGTDLSDGQAWSYRLTNLAGQTVQTASDLYAAQVTLSMEGIPVGMYLLEIRSANGATMVQKLVKQ